ncbi:photosystem II protein J (chloroplast) [Galdieria partita]|jgi:photosystem II PsbJ protein|uniref:Photosystem II reaction center protein J n=3 Tax=Galdieria TaxID=83373 RepID=D4NY73_GALSU|nr:photosystem II protein J [Galdieria sulphuraria]YP_010713713.1 photosystem II protein J [Galdieria phlegrea]UNJ16153.1 photosystem II protein J [Galdieria sp.]WDA99278.1 photosystem II protein J [Galdieria yellowstonensis]BDE17681.1 photosystem II protein J [Galdieria partita]ADD54631.1 photosystem II J protein [Galdieria sulphuraria]AIG92578.1 photosystem II protein J [Galdieria sulphuraria]
MSQTGRVPLWLIATIGGIGLITVMGLFFYGSYSGIGSAL